MIKAFYFDRESNKPYQALFLKLEDLNDFTEECGMVFIGIKIITVNEMLKDKDFEFSYKICLLAEMFGLEHSAHSDAELEAVVYNYVFNVHPELDIRL